MMDCGCSISALRVIQGSRVMRLANQAKATKAGGPPRVNLDVETSYSNFLALAIRQNKSALRGYEVLEVYLG